jgi:hypothetical protein
MNCEKSSIDLPAAGEGGPLGVLWGYSGGTLGVLLNDLRTATARRPPAVAGHVARSATWPHSLARSIDRSDGRVDRPRTRRRHSAP